MAYDAARCQLGEHDGASGVLQPEIIVHSLVELLLATQIVLRCLNR